MMQLPRRCVPRDLVAAVVVLALLGVSACSSGTGGGAGSGSGNGKVVVGATLAPPTLDLTTDAAAAVPQALLYNVYEGLVKLDESGRIQPLLAKSWDKKNNGRVYVFHLRKATFHNGKAFTAKDVVFSINRVLAPDSTHPHKDQMAVVESAEAIDPRTVKVTLERPSWNWLFYMTGPVGVILEKSAIDRIATHPVGTGPYQFDGMKKGYSLTLQRYGDYRGEPAGTETVVFRYIEDPNALANAVLAGDIDITAGDIAPETLGRFNNDPRFVVKEGLTNGEVILTMNNSKKPFDDERVRKAVTYAINREQLLETAYSGYGKLVGTHASPADPWFTELADYYYYNPRKAKELLAEAGYPDGFSMTLKLPPPNYARESGKFIASQLAQVGIDVKLVNVEWALWLDRVFGKGDYEATIVSHVEPRDMIKYGDPSYYWHYDNAKVQRLLEQGDSAHTREQFIGAYQEVARTITQDAVNNWLFLLPNLVVAQSGLAGYPVDAYSLSFDVTNIHWKRDE